MTAKPVQSAPAIPDLFLSFRRRFQLTQTEAAGFVGMSSASWGSWEKGERPPPPARILVTLLIHRPELLELLVEDDFETSLPPEA